MSQPDYVPLVHSDRVRASKRLSLPGHWVQDRPAELVSLRRPRVSVSPRPGPDLGFGLKLAEAWPKTPNLPRVSVSVTPWPAVSLPGRNGLRSCTEPRLSTTWSGPLRYGASCQEHPRGLSGSRKPLFAGAGHDYARRPRHCRPGAGKAGQAFARRCGRRAPRLEQVVGSCQGSLAASGSWWPPCPRGAQGPRRPPQGRLGPPGQRHWPWVPRGRCGAPCRTAQCRGRFDEEPGAEVGQPEKGLARRNERA